MTEISHDASSIRKETITECRGCLQQIFPDSTFYNIFNCLEQDGMDTTIAEKLSKITNIQISETDSFPKVICQVCCALLQSACTFISNVQKSEHILKQRIENMGCNVGTKRVWPKPIQIDKVLQNSVYNTTIEMKEEMLSGEEFSHEASQEQDFAKLDIKIEPEELQRQHLSQIPLVNGTHSMDHSKLKSKYLQNGNDDPQEIVMPKVVRERKRYKNKMSVRRPAKTSTERSREHRERLKALKNAASSSIISKTKPKTSAERSRNYRSRKRARQNENNQGSHDLQRITVKGKVHQERENSHPSTSTLPMKKIKTSTERCREFRARKKQSIC